MLPASRCALSPPPVHLLQPESVCLSSTGTSPLIQTWRKHALWTFKAPVSVSRRHLRITLNGSFSCVQLNYPQHPLHRRGTRSSTILCPQSVPASWPDSLSPSLPAPVILPAAASRQHGVSANQTGRLSASPTGICFSMSYVGNGRVTFSPARTTRGGGHDSRHFICTITGPMTV